MKPTHVDTGRGQVYLHGATVTHWEHAGRPVLFLSERARFVAGRGIRGGVPLVFPWFGGDPEGRGRPAHGFARSVPWRLLAHGGDTVSLELVDDAATRALWEHRFRLRFDVEFGDELHMRLSIENRGDEPSSCQCALHTYFAVADVRRCTVRGLAGRPYLDKTQDQKPCVQEDELIRFSQEVDRTYFGTASTCEIDDVAGERVIEVHKTGALSTIVWNPWTDWARRTADFGDDEWQRMVCVESGNVGEDALTLAAGAAHSMAVRVVCR